jgi:hypothetical protein
MTIDLYTLLHNTMFECTFSLCLGAGKVVVRCTIEICIRIHLLNIIKPLYTYGSYMIGIQGGILFSESLYVLSLCSKKTTSTSDSQLSRRL